MASAQAAMIQQQALAMVAGMMEAKLDAEIDRLDNLGEADIETIRKQRMADLRKKQEKSKEWLAKGHGERVIAAPRCRFDAPCNAGSYEEIPDEKAFFASMKGEERMVCHFFMDTSLPCKVRD